MWQKIKKKLKTLKQWLFRHGCVLFQAFLPLLKKAASVGSSGSGLSCSRAAIINVTTRMGSIDDNTSGGKYAYRSSKVLLYLVLLVFFHASTEHNVARSIMFLSCLSVYQFVHCAISRKVLNGFSSHLRWNDALWESECLTFGVKSQRSRSLWNKMCWKQLFMGAIQYLPSRFELRVFNFPTVVYLSEWVTKYLPCFFLLCGFY